MSDFWDIQNLNDLLSQLRDSILDERYDGEITQDDYIGDAELQAIDTLMDYLDNL